MYLDVSIDVYVLPNTAQNSGRKSAIIAAWSWSGVDAVTMRSLFVFEHRHRGQACPPINISAHYMYFPTIPRHRVC